MRGRVVMMRDRFILLVVVTLTLAACGIHSRSVHVERSRPAGTSVRSGSTPARVASLRVRVCPTTYGAQSKASSSLPARLPVELSYGVGHDLMAYTDTRGLLFILAPKGWSCSGSYGADGSGGVIAYPGGQGTPPSSWGAGWRLPANSTARAVSGFETAASPVQAAARACSFFEDAAKLFASEGFPRCQQLPTGVQVTAITPTIVGFQADAHVYQGVATPSGGNDPANAVITYSPTADPGSYGETCTLPNSMHAICTAVLNSFLRSYRAK